MAKSNYAAWQINKENFDVNWSDADKLHFFAKYAILAPSGHNTQPWKFSQSGQTLVVQADRSRVLPYSGVQANEPYVSLGACIETLVLGAQGFGYGLKIKYIVKADVIAHITIAGPTKPVPVLLDAITERVSNRYLYDTKALSPALTSTITACDFKSVAAQVIADKAGIEYIAEQTSLATHRIFGDKQFRLELSKWVRNNKTKQFDGMPGFVQEIPTPPSMLAKHIIKRINVSKDQSNKDTKRILHSPNLILVNIKDDSPTALLDAGRLYARICILAQQHGLASSGLGTAIIDPIARDEIIKKLRVTGKPIAIIRVGKAAKAARHTPRWPLSAVSS